MIWASWFDDSLSGGHTLRRELGDTGGGQWDHLSRGCVGLGHESFKTTVAHYARREAVAGAQQKRALAVLTGRRLAS